MSAKWAVCNIMKSLHGQVPHIFFILWMSSVFSTVMLNVCNVLHCMAFTVVLQQQRCDELIVMPIHGVAIWWQSSSALAQGCEQYHTIWDIYPLLVLLLGDCHNGCKHWPGGWNSLRPCQTWRHSGPCLQVNWSLFDEHLLKHRPFPPCWNFKDQVVDSLPC